MPPKKRASSSNQSSKSPANVAQPKQTTLSAPSSSEASSGASFTDFEVPNKPKPIPCTRSHPSPSNPISLIFTHGAGGTHSAPAMLNFGTGFSSVSPVIMFTGNMNLAGRAKMFETILSHEQTTSTDSVDTSKLAYGGRSMGSRAAVVACHTDENIKMLVLASYPLVAPSGDVRDKILFDLRDDVDVLFISGDGDSMCKLSHLNEVRAKMKSKSWLVTVKGADHGMNLKGGKSLKKGTEEVGKQAGRIAASWMTDRDENNREIVLRWDGDAGAVKGDWAGEFAAEKQSEKAGIKRFFQANDGEKDNSAEKAGPKKRAKK